MIATKTLSSLAFAIAVAVTVAAFTSCTTTDRGLARKSSVQWRFDSVYGALSGPRTNVYLIINGGEYLVLKESPSAYRSLDANEEHPWNIPDASLAACTSWWAGAGDVLYVIVEGGAFAVYQTHLAEGQDETPPFEIIETIKPGEAN